MVTALVDRLGQTLPVCFARPLLFKASDVLENGNIIAAGCLLREAARRFVECQCKYHDCLPPMKARRSAMLLARALKKAGHCSGDSFDCLIDIVDNGNKAAHCHYVKPGTLEACICLLHALMDEATGFIEFKREGGAV